VSCKTWHSCLIDTHWQHLPQSGKQLRTLALDLSSMQKVDFEPPVLSFMENVNGGLHLRIGKESDVTLATTYLDERVRIGKGSR